MKRALILPKKKSHLPAVVKSLIIFFNLEKQKAIIVSGYFNPIHKGRLEYFNNAKALAIGFLLILIFKNTITEMLVCEEMNVAFIDGLGDKIQSSS